MRPGLLKRAHSHNNRQSFSHLLHTRGNSPHPHPDTVSGYKQIEEETLPKYNADHFYPVRLGDVLNDRYKILVKLGFGMTATVWLAKDLHADPHSGNRKYVTIKINVNTLSDEFLKGRREIAQKLCSANPTHPGYNHIRFMLDTFRVKGKHGEHLCIVYDVLREPIDICMEKFPGRRFSSDKLRKLIPALLHGLDYLHTECRVVHTDLKADNIMMGLGDPTILDRFVQHEMEHPSPRKLPDSHGRIIYTSRSDFGEAPTDAVIASAKITDIGLATWGDVKNTKPIQSNAFMAPEVILQCGWSYPADIWNLGVMLWDLIESFGLFDAIETGPGHYHPDQHLGLMIALLGPPPKELLKRGAKTSNYFDSQGEFKHPDYVTDDITFESSISRMKGEEKELFIDFAKKMIMWLPEERWTAKQLLEHPFLTKERECAVPNPSLSRASTASFNSIIPSGMATPGPSVTSAATSARTSKNLEKVPSHTSMAHLTEAALVEEPSKSSTTNDTSTTSNPSTTNDTSTASNPFTNDTSTASNPSAKNDISTMTLPHHLKKEDRTVSGSGRHPIPNANKCSQELIDAILNKGKEHHHTETK
ncbi:uncharacterized protein Z518_04977 [Rhinocladiella mackenziei CBS 650.93]|uniref:non-specific serine/threonine protein kinase n=1 Tax=Rhinocladiella mackenziei CBS 650.93 TaxID=1442369 RepID=A0A0D2IV35_9EURO|nr:uncharacterized protein Z518_04977 [Rhinocladiella mackenziei CBS 650.93]KIX07001.1 hypothetical protein Z518_04977 [Rhinocladiella mackenziei CBS 650.93]